MLKKNFLCIFHWVFVSIVIIILDQLSKFLAVHYLEFQKTVIINKFFNLYLDYNKGASFSFLKYAGGWQVFLFAGIAVIVSLGIIIYLIKHPELGFLTKTGLALVLGGALGNLVDRCLHRYVIDFISWHWKQYYFPTFNIADSAVTVGVIFLLLGLKEKK